MTNEFTAWCNQYYRLKTLINEQDEHFKTLLDNAPPYTNQTNLSDLDEIICCNRKVLAAKTKVDKTLKELTEAKHAILEIMKYFEIPPLKMLTGQIPYELEYKVWVDKNDEVYIIKTRDLPQKPVNPNIITIKCVMSRDGSY